MQTEHLFHVAAMHVVIAKTNPKSKDYLAAPDSGIKKLRESGERFRIVARHMSQDRSQEVSSHNAAAGGRPCGAVPVVEHLCDLEELVGVAGFEPATPSSRTRCATRLRYTPTTGGAEL